MCEAFSPPFFPPLPGVGLSQTFLKSLLQATWDIYDWLASDQASKLNGIWGEEGRGEKRQLKFDVTRKLLVTQKGYEILMM